MTTRCPRCDAAHDGAPNYCTRCGYALTSVAADPPEAAAVDPVSASGNRSDLDARFVVCKDCGATNAASRRRCGRCAADLSGEGSELAVAPREEPAAVAEAEPSSPVVFLLAVALAAVAIVGVIITILSASGVGPFAREPAPPQEVPFEVSSVRASSAREADAPDLLVDGDPGTAWHEDASGDGVGEWVELRLAGNPDVNRLVLWNGDQGADAASARPAELRIDLGDRTFSATLLDVDGPQAIDLPEVVEASSVRVTIVAVEGTGPAAMSELEVRGPPPEAVAPEDGAQSSSVSSADST